MLDHPDPGTHVPRPRSPPLDNDSAAESESAPEGVPGPGAPPPGGGPPGDDRGDGPDNLPDHPGFQRCRHCDILIPWFDHFTWDRHNAICPNRPAAPPAAGASAAISYLDRTESSAVVAGSRQSTVNPLDASDLEHTLVTETESRQATEELVMHDLQNISGKQSSPGNLSQAAGHSPPIMLHSEYQLDEGTLSVESFSAQRAATAVKPEHSVSPFEGAPAGYPPVDQRAIESEGVTAPDVPVFGNAPPLRSPSSTRPTRPFESYPSPNPDRELRRRNAQEITVDTIPVRDEASYPPHGRAAAESPNQIRVLTEAPVAPPVSSAPGPGFRAMHHSPVYAPPTSLPDLSVLSEESNTTGSADPLPFPGGPHVPDPTRALPRETATPPWVPAMASRNPSGPALSGHPRPWITGESPTHPTPTAYHTGAASNAPSFGGMTSHPDATGGTPTSGQGSLTSHRPSSTQPYPIDAGSESAHDLARRQDASDARALQLEHRLNTVATDLQTSLADSRLMLREMITEMSVAAGVAAAQASATALASVEQAALVAAEVAAAQAKTATLAQSNMTSLISVSNAAATDDRAEMMASIPELRLRTEVNERHSASAWDDLSTQIRQIQEGRDHGPASVLPLSNEASARHQADAASGPASVPAQIASDWNFNTWGSTDRAPQPITDAGRARVRLQELEQDRAHASNVELDLADVDRARSRDTRAGVSAILGRGHLGILPHPVTPRRAPESSVMGKGPREFQADLPIPLEFTDSVES